MPDSLYIVSACAFEAARKVDILPSTHPSAKLHGHSFLAKVRTQISDEWAEFHGNEVSKLTQSLYRTLKPLDYAFLNNELEVPTDENLARWVRNHLELTNAETIGIQSTADQGVDLDGTDHIHLWRRFRFEAAHQLPNVPAGHQCGRMHGHGFEVIIHLDQDISRADMGIDYDLIEQLWSPFYEQLDHRCLNDIAGLENPTSEVLAGWLWDRLKPESDALSWISVYETHTSGCHYDGNHYRIWKEQRFESACSLPNAPDGDKRKRLHGHSYLVRLHLTAPLDDVMGWTVDYGDVKELFKPTYKLLDHHNLNDLPGIEIPSTSNLLYWMRNNLAGCLPELDRIDLFETPGCGAVLSWGEQGPALPV